MPPRPRPLCVHCLAAEGTTDDHGVPTSWYPDGSAAHIARPKAPACRSCNARLAKVEEAVLIPLALSLEPTDPRSAGVPDRVMRSMDPKLARDDADRRARQARRRRVQARLFQPPSSVGAFPGCGRTETGGELALPLSHSELAIVGEKLTRVIYWSESATYIGQSHAVVTHVVQPGDDERRVAGLIRGGHRIEIPPGVFVAVRRAADDPVSGLLVIELWGRVQLFTSVLPTDAERQPPPI